MLLVHKEATKNGKLLELKDQTFNVFEVDLESKSLFLLIDFTDLVLFLGFRGRRLALSLNGLASIKGTSIYFCTGIPRNPIIVSNIEDEEVESILMDIALHDGHKRISRSIHPFTLAHHLATYCTPLNW